MQKLQAKAARENVLINKPLREHRTWMATKSQLYEQPSNLEFAFPKAPTTGGEF